MKNWLSPISQKAPVPVKADSTALSRAEFDRKVASFRKASGIKDSCQMTFLCSKTRRPFEVIFERESPHQLFEVAAIEHVAAVAKGASRSSPSSSRHFNIEAFSWDRWHCAGCAAESFILCGRCGTYYCDAYSELRDGAGARYGCPACGHIGRIVTLQAIDTSDSRSNRKKPGTSTAPSQSALPRAPSTPLLPRGRR